MLNDSKLCFFLSCFYTFLVPNYLKRFESFYAFNYLDKLEVHKYIMLFIVNCMKMNAQIKHLDHSES